MDSALPLGRSLFLSAIELLVKNDPDELNLRYIESIAGRFRSFRTLVEVKSFTVSGARQSRRSR